MKPHSFHASRRCFTFSCSSLPSTRMAVPCDPTVMAVPSNKAWLGSLSRARQASVMHCGNIAWVLPEHAMQLQCTTAASEELCSQPRGARVVSQFRVCVRGRGLLGPVELCKLPGANAEPWPTAVHPELTAEGQQDLGLREPSRSTREHTWPEGSAWGQQAMFWGSGCLPGLCPRQPQRLGKRKAGQSSYLPKSEHLPEGPGKPHSRG